MDIVIDAAPEYLMIEAYDLRIFSIFQELKIEDSIGKIEDPYSRFKKEVKKVLNLTEGEYYEAAEVFFKLTMVDDGGYYFRRPIFIDYSLNEWCTRNLDAFTYKLYCYLVWYDGAVEKDENGECELDVREVAMVLDDEDRIKEGIEALRQLGFIDCYRVDDNIYRLWHVETGD